MAWYDIMQHHWTYNMTCGSMSLSCHVCQHVRFNGHRTIAEVAKGCKTTHSKTLKHSLHETLELKDFRNILKISRFQTEPTSSVDCPIFQPGNNNQNTLKACISMHRFDTLDAMSGSLYAAYLAARYASIGCVTSNHSTLKMMQISRLSQGPVLTFGVQDCWRLVENVHSQGELNAEVRHHKGT